MRYEFNTVSVLSAVWIQNRAVIFHPISQAVPGHMEIFIIYSIQELESSKYLWKRQSATASEGSDDVLYDLEMSP